MLTQDTYDIVDTVVCENEEFEDLTQRHILKVSDILDEEVENGITNKLELKKIAYRELLKLA